MRIGERGSESEIKQERKDQRDIDESRVEINFRQMERHVMES